MYDFHVGQRVICTDDKIHKEWETPGNFYVGGLDGLTRGEIYTISNMKIWHDGMLLISLAEIKRSIPPWIDHLEYDGYSAYRFRPLEEKQDGIEWARQICHDVSNGKVLEIA